MGLVYDPPRGTYTTNVPPGTTALRYGVAEHFGISRSEVIRDRDRCGSDDPTSTHCECRGVDWFPTRLPNGQHDLARGRAIFDFLVANADALGVQGVIYDGRRWGFGKWYERPITSGHQHDDHVHGEETIAASKSLTRAQVDALLAPSPTPIPEPEDDDMDVLGYYDDNVDPNARIFYWIDGQTQRWCRTPDEVTIVHGLGLTKAASLSEAKVLPAAMRKRVPLVGKVPTGLDATMFTRVG